MKRILYVGWIAALIVLATLTACNAGGEDGIPTNDGNQPGPSVTGSPGETPQSPDAPLDVDAISILWQASSHADTYVLDGNGANSDCTRCHAPINYVPSLEEIPESCFMCKFELTTPPPLTEKDIWEAIPCNVCHELDKKGNAKPEVSWLESAVAELYSEVATTTELCLKCHIQVNIPGHKPENTFSTTHANMVCTDCHDAHSVEATCSTSGCHEGIMAAIPGIAGHDANHDRVACVTCHDAGGYEVDINETSGYWLTFATIDSTDGGGSILVPYASHDISKEAACERCHYSGNPWQLVEDVATNP